MNLGKAMFANESKWLWWNTQAFYFTPSLSATKYSSSSSSFSRSMLVHIHIWILSTKQKQLILWICLNCNFAPETSSIRSSVSNRSVTSRPLYYYPSSASTPVHHRLGEPLISASSILLQCSHKSLHFKPALK